MKAALARGAHEATPAAMPPSTAASSPPRIRRAEEPLSISQIIATTIEPSRQAIYLAWGRGVDPFCGPAHLRVGLGAPSGDKRIVGAQGA